MSHSIEPEDADPQTNQEISGRQAYNVISDTVAGPNVRLRDNLFQAIAIFVCVVVGAGLGALFFKERIGGALGCGFAGLLVGLFGSGLFLMIYRFVRHAKGRHD